ncbi:hypothetical protein BHE74_00057905 [Ensete ventricosum]|nr:hypothetical protein BHE74_00057905 [Ensete ventricosum]
MELQLDDGPRSSFSIGSGFERCSGISLEFARRFTEGIEKLAENMSGDCRKKTIGLMVKMLEATGLAGVQNDFRNWSQNSNIPKKSKYGRFSRRPGPVNNRKYPKSRLLVVQPPNVGSLAIDRCPKS